MESAEHLDNGDILLPPGKYDINGEFVESKEGILVRKNGDLINLI